MSVFKLCFCSKEHRYTFGSIFSYIQIPFVEVLDKEWLVVF